MLLDKVDDIILTPYLEKNKDPLDFDPERYDIYFEYKDAAGAMVYMAVRKDPDDESIPLGYFFTIKANLSIKPAEGLPYLPFLLYLIGFEKSLSMEEQKELYGDAYYTLGSMAGLSDKQLAEREKTRKAFISFVGKLEEKGLLREKYAGDTTLRLVVEMEGVPDQKKALCFRLKLGESGGKAYYCSNASNFLTALRFGNEFAVNSRLLVQLSPEAFEESWKLFVERLLDYVQPDSGAGRQPYFQVPIKRLWGFFSLLPQELSSDVLQTVEGPWKVVKPDQKASLSLDSGGSLILDPPVSSAEGSVNFFLSDLNLTVFRQGTREVELYRFEDQLQAELFGYFATSTAKDFSYVSDLFIQKVLPVSKGMMRKAKNTDFRIAVHISWEGGALSFQTEYFVGEEKKKAEFFEGKPFEQALIQTYASTMESLHGSTSGKVEDSNDILFFLKSDLGPLRQVASVYLDEKLKRLKIRKGPSVQIRASRNMGWLSLSFHSDAFSEEELEKIFAAYRKKKAFFLLKDDLILLEPETLEPVERIIEEVGAQKSLEEVSVPFFNVMMLESYREGGADISMDDYVKTAVTEIVGYKDASLSLPEPIENALRPYQADGVRWMTKLSEYGCGGILADDMGLGKTLEVLSFLAASSYEKPVLIVCPKSLVYNWRNEIHKWLGDVEAIVIAGAKQERMRLIGGISPEDRGIYITGYDSLRTDIEAYKEKSFFLVVADEAQNIKNASTQKAKAIRKLEGENRLALTGTPVENSLTDLWSIYDFLMPGYLGSSTSFQKTYGTDSGTESARAVLAKKVAPFLLRRRKEEVLDSLPGKEVILLTVSMADEQRKLYEAYLHKARELSKEEQGVSVLSALTQLRQICVDPSVFLEDYEETSGKVSVALEQVQTSIHAGHRLLIFSSFTRVLEHFRYILEEKDIRSYYISGSTPASVRVDMAEKFNKEDKVKVMLVSIKAGGTGLNLVGADTVIHLDPWWNFAVEEQATDRAYRIGQTKPVTVYKLVAHDSIEEKIIALQEKKRQASDDVVQTEMNGIKAFTAEDIKYILQ